MEEKKIDASSGTDNLVETKLTGKKSHSSIGVLSIPLLEKLGAFVSKNQTQMKSVDWGGLNAAFAGVSFLSDTLLNIEESNKVRAIKYPSLASNLADAAACSWFLSLLVDFRSYERLGFCVDGVSDPEQRKLIIEEKFSVYYRENIAWLGQVVIERVPGRAFALGPALAAHFRGEYALSVPVFLSQAEGILRDMTSAELYTKRHHVSDYATAKRSEINIDNTWFRFSDDSFWAQLSGDLPIGWGPNDRRDNSYKGINRNTTLHGIDKDYATEVNSLKTFSLLCHIAGLLSTLSKEINAAGT